MSYYNYNCLSPVKSYAPIRQYFKSDVPMDGCTTYKLSYWPTEAPVKVGVYLLVSNALG